MRNESSIPKEGLYVSQIDPTMKFVVTAVVITNAPGDTDSDEVTYHVKMAKAGDQGDMAALGYELDPDEWWQFVIAHQLEFAGKA